MTLITIMTAIKASIFLSILLHPSDGNEESSYLSASFWEKYSQQEIEDIQQTIIRQWRAKNVILFIGDGFGLSELVAARIFQGQNKSDALPGELNRLSMEEKLPFVALSKTFSTSHQVSDSAATAFAILSGIKTDSGTFGFSGGSVEFEKCGSGLDHLPTMADHVKAVGKRVGVVTTARVTHATPGALYAKTESRNWEGSAPDGCTDIATQLMQQQKNKLLDVVFGGGMKHLWPNDKVTPFQGKSARTDDVNHVETWENQGGKVVQDISGLQKLKPSDMPVLGVFSDSHLNYEGSGAKPSSEPKLQDMALKAMELLESKNKNGYFLLIEGARIDMGQHANEPYLTLTEVDAFDKTIKAIMEKVDLDETLVIVTADHEHAFSITGYPSLNNPILGFSRDSWKNETGDQATLTYGASPSQTQAPPSNTNEYHPGFKYPGALNGSQGRHGGADVVILANGPMAHLVQGFRMQSYIGHLMQYATCTGLYKSKCSLEIIDTTSTLRPIELLILMPICLLFNKFFYF